MSKFERFLNKQKYIIIPTICLTILLLLLYFLLRIFIKTDENLIAECFVISGVTGVIVNFMISISTMQLIEFFLYFTYKIKKIFNKHYTKYNDPIDFQDFHNYYSSDSYVRMWFSYLLSILFIIFGLVYFKLLPTINKDEITLIYPNLLKIFLAFDKIL